MQADRELRSSRYGSDAVSYRKASHASYGLYLHSAEFAQVGNDMKATQFLAELDNDRSIGGLIDWCVSAEYWSPPADIQYLVVRD